jgi:phage gp45-like
MIAQAVRKYVSDKIEAAIRQVVLRGRASAGLFSLEGHAVAPGEPESATTARRGGRYGFLSECPAGALVTIVKVGRGNFVAVAETTPSEPAIEDGEVLVWSTHGQRLKFTKDGDVVVTPKAGRKVLLGSATDGACDPVVTKSELNAVLAKIRAHTHPSVGALAGDFTDSNPVGLSVDGSPVVEATKP